MPPSALRHAMESALLLVVVESASGVFVRLPTKRSIFSSTLMNGCFTTQSEYAFASGKASGLPQRLAHGMRVALQVNDWLVHAQTMQKVE
jgi:hypothetical protein